MQKIRLSNGIKLLYEKVPGDITSFTIGFDAGANKEEKDKLGIAHATEHMIFKGTKTKTEKEINDLCNEYLGFHNAMTNYPYVVYYGSCLKEDFEKGFGVYFDIVFNPAFKEEGFKEEISVILEELREWGDDVVQHCEDMLFFNTFKNRRIKELIIGKEELIKKFKVEDLKNFHKMNYTEQNCVISVVTSLNLNEVVSIIESNIQIFKSIDTRKNIDIDFKNNLPYNEKDLMSDDYDERIYPLYENPITGIFEEENYSINGCKVQYIFPIHELSEREITVLRLFNEFFADGTSSILYDEIRTKRGLVYDIQGKVKSEKGIKLYTITLSTAEENLEKVLDIIEENLVKIKSNEYPFKDIFNDEFFRKYCKSQNRKRMMSLEKSIVMSMNLVVYEIMHSSSELLLNEFNTLNYPTQDKMIEILNKVFEIKSVGIIRSV